MMHEFSKEAWLLSTQIKKNCTAFQVQFLLHHQVATLTVSDIAASFDSFYIRVHYTAMIVMEDTDAKKCVYQLILTMHSFDFR